MDGYTTSILNALELRHFSAAQVQAAMRIGLSRWEGLKSGRYELSDRELDCIEALVGRSAGQLAYQGSGMDDRGLAKVLNEFAKVGRPEPKAKRAKSVSRLTAAHR